MPAYENTLYLYRLVEIHTEILWCVYTHTNTRTDTQRLSLHKRCCSLTKKLTQQYVREEEKKKNLQLCRKLFCKSLLAVQNVSRRTLADPPHTNMNMEPSAKPAQRASEQLKSVPCSYPDVVVPPLNVHLDGHRETHTPKNQPQLPR